MSVQPEARAHGEAWRAFVNAPWVPSKLLSPEPGSNDAVIARNAWLCFLAGWLAKAKQADQLRGRRL